MKTTLKIIGAALLLATTACQQEYATRSAAFVAAEKYTAALSQSFPGSNNASTRGLIAKPRALYSNPFGSSTPTNIWNNWSGAANSGGYNFGNGNSPFDPFSFFSNQYGSVNPNNWNQWGGNWNSTQHTGVYGNSLMYPSMVDETSRCMNMVASIPERIENLDFMIGTLERCLFRLAVHKSAPMTYVARNDNPQILNYMGYVNDYVRPARYGSYSQDPYNQFLLNGQTGFIPADGGGLTSYYVNGY